MTVMLTCNDANDLIVRTIDDALSGGERAALRRHLVSCTRCRAEYETQHEVRRVLAVHLQDRLPAGFDHRLRARLAEASRPLVFGAMQRDLRDIRDTRGRTWALRLIPLAATLMLIVAGTSVRDDVPRPASVSGAAPGPPRAFTTVALPRTASDRAARRHRPSTVSPNSPIAAEDVALAPTRSLGDDDGGERHPTQAVTESAAARGTDRVPVSQPREQERERVARRDGGDARDKRVGDKRAEDEAVDSEPVDTEPVEGDRAASQQPGILPRPATPIPPARPAMPAPPAAFPDRTIPPM
jgi:anti-sigma factor RsiW